MKKRTAHYVLSSHWDREWYQTFQDFRHRLVHLMDRTLDAIASGRLQGPFTTDGQAIMLEDYLEVRGERREQVTRMLQEGSLVSGPWYVLPDEWLVSGESLLRNLRKGREVVRRFGAKPSDAGFVCDLFGHIGQLPQILAGFGIQGGFIWRGIEPFGSAHCMWSGSDGTSLPCFRFGRTGYCDYATDVRHASKHTQEFDRAKAVTDLRAYLAREGARSSLDSILLFDGGDHLEYEQEHYDVLRSADAAKSTGFAIVHTSLDAYLADMLKQVGRIRHTISGELRETGRLPGGMDEQWLIPGVLSSRVWIKQHNAECESLLCNWAEPVGALAHLELKREYPAGFLDVAWKWLLMNHPHDSICGCSIDEVHEDMKFRFAQTRQIARRQASEAARSIAASVSGDIGANELRVTLFNPLCQTFDEPVELTLRIPGDWPCYAEFFGFEPKPSFRIFDADNRELSFQACHQTMNRIQSVIRPHKFTQGCKTNDVTIGARVTIPARGYTTLVVRAAEKVQPEGASHESLVPVRHPARPGLCDSERSMQNEYLRVVIESNGALTVTDRRNGEIYSRLLTFEDSADIGDGWYHGQAVNDQTFVSTAARADVALVCDGPLHSTFRVRVVMPVPAEFEFESKCRSDTFANLVMDSHITLRAGLDRVEVATTVRNAARDHRLRVLFPSGAECRTYLADGSFDVVERPIALPENNHLGREIAVETRPQYTWTAVSDKARGLAVVSSGLLEATVRDLPDRPIALTLFRGTRRTVTTDGQPEGQLLGDLRFRYWLVPVAGKVDRPRLCGMGTLLAAGIHAEQLRPEDLKLYRTAEALPPAMPFVEVGGGAVVTSLRETAAGLELRLFNPETATRKISINTAGRCTECLPVTFESHVCGKPLPVRNGTIHFPLPAKRIRTLLMKLKQKPL